MENNQIVALIISLFLLIFIIRSIQQAKLKEKFALLWIISSLSLIFFSVWFEPIQYLALVFGINNPVNFFFILGAFYLIFINLHLSFSISKEHENFKIIAQKIAFLQHQLNQNQLNQHQINQYQQQLNQLNQNHKSNQNKP